MKRQRRPDYFTEFRETRECEIKSALDAAAFFRAAAEVARERGTAYGELLKRARQLTKRAEQLRDELAELRGEPPEQEEDDA